MENGKCVQSRCPRLCEHVSNVHLSVYLTVDQREQTINCICGFVRKEQERERAGKRVNRTVTMAFYGYFRRIMLCLSCVLRTKHDRNGLEAGYTQLKQQPSIQTRENIQTTSATIANSASVAAMTKMHMKLLAQQLKREEHIYRNGFRIG